jgi:hypothetical protein
MFPKPINVSHLQAEQPLKVGFKTPFIGLMYRQNHSHETNVKAL